MAMVAEDIVLYQAALPGGGWKKQQQQRLQRERERARQCKPEPSIFTCGTCKSVYSSSWFLVQHVQKTHGLKIYEEPRDSSPPPSSVPARPIVVQPDKLLADQLRSGKDSPATGPASLSSPFHKATNRHRSPTCSPRTGSGGSSGDMFSFPTPFMPGAPRQPSGSPGSAWPPYGRSPIVSEFPAMMHPEMMMDQLRRIQGMVAAGTGDHPAIPGMPPFLRPPTLDHATGGQYSHSERLRLLAATGGGNTSPKHIPPHTSRNSSKPDTSSFMSPTQSTPPSAFTTPTTTSTSVPIHDSSNTVTTSGGRQLKQCEFCNKQFRFASNLVLHRRLHTGERPYACPLCTFTSAQATKLRTHMRSHVTAPADTAAAADPNKLSDSDIEDTEEFVQREAEAEVAIRQLELEAKQQKEEEEPRAQGDAEPTDLSSNGRQSVESSSSPAPAATHDNNEEDDEDIVTDRASLLSEVMMKTGLSNLPNYKEAFTAALAEANHAKSPQHLSPKPNTPSTKDEKAEGGEMESPVKTEPRDESVHDYTDGEVEEENDDSVVDDVSISSHRRSPQSRGSSDFSNADQPPEKRIKRENSPLATVVSRSPSSTTFPGADHLFQRAAMEAAATHIYPGLWFPPSTSAGGLPFPPFMHRSGEHAAAAMMSAAAASSRLQAAAAAATSENGLSPQASSAFSNNGSPKLPSPDPSGLGGLAQGSAKRRNDTCEFCGKVFKNCSNLTVHRRSHTGEKPYKCQLCPYACAQSSKLTRHMRTHGRHGKDVYRCKFCCMPFSVPSTLEKHMRKCVESQQRAAAAARHLTSPLAPVV